MQRRNDELSSRKMRLSPLVVFYICAGILGLLSGNVVMSFRKGSHGHRMLPLFNHTWVANRPLNE